VAAGASGRRGTERRALFLAVRPGSSNGRMRIHRSIRIGIAAVALLAASGCEAPSSHAPPPRVDAILVEKTARRLSLLSNGVVVRSYVIALGRNPVGPKEREGDDRTPEGAYVIDGRNPDSGYHLALHISYPNAADRARAAKLGADPGGDIMIHGIRNGLGWLGPVHRWLDWTHGCIAVTDAEIDEIASRVPDGTPIEIRP
jgi:murein L,D-transpeptidase YafK